LSNKVADDNIDCDVSFFLSESNFFRQLNCTRKSWPIKLILCHLL